MLFLSIKFASIESVLKARPMMVELTALGIAYVAGSAAGVDVWQENVVTADGIIMFITMIFQIKLEVYEGFNS